jgi:hypothetical protein
MTRVMLQIVASLVTYNLRLGLGNCDFHAEQKISVMNETKRYKIGSKRKV